MDSEDDDTYNDHDSDLNDSVDEADDFESDMNGTVDEEDDVEVAVDRNLINYQVLGEPEIRQLQDDDVTRIVTGLEEQRHVGVKQERAYEDIIVTETPALEETLLSSI